MTVVHGCCVVLGVLALFLAWDHPVFVRQYRTRDPNTGVTKETLVHHKSSLTSFLVFILIFMMWYFKSVRACVCRCRNLCRCVTLFRWVCRGVCVCVCGNVQGGKRYGILPQVRVCVCDWCLPRTSVCVCVCVPPDRHWLFDGEPVRSLSLFTSPLWSCCRR